MDGRNCSNRGKVEPLMPVRTSPLQDENRKPTTAIYPGSFNPMTLGHANILQRALTLFDEVVVMIANNPKKEYEFTLHDRIEIVERTVHDIAIPEGKKIRIGHTEGIVADYINAEHIQAIIRGIRNATDLDYEFQLEQYNQHATSAETIYLSPYTEHLNTSSTLVRMFCQSGKLKQAEKFLSPSAFEYIQSKMK